MKFGPLQLVYFKAEAGAFSEVMEDEEGFQPGSGQINVDQLESEVIFSVFPRATIHRGPKKSAVGGINKPFVSWADGRTIQVQINFPKTDKPNELRIYVPTSGDFSPPAGHVWFVFRRAGQLFIGHMPEPEWRSIGRIDVDDSQYLETVYEQTAASPPAASTVTTLRFPRDPALAVAAFERAGYCCEFDPTAALFTSRKRGKPYLEPHHLIPRALQPCFKLDLDHLDNIYALSPHHHRRIHYGTIDDTVEILDRLLNLRAAPLVRYGVSRQDLLELYNCLPII
jgi:hypothetical protein